jgi:CheY-like chemotaxis protein
MRPIKRSGRRLERSRELILYIKDEVENRDVARLRPERDYELVFAATDEEACQVLKARGDELAAVLMDIQLKGSALDGIQLTRLIKGRFEGDRPAYAEGVPELSAPVLFVSAYGTRYPEDELKAAGGVQLIAKPVDFVELSLPITRHHLDVVTQRMKR